MTSIWEWLPALDACLVSDALDSLELLGAVPGVLPVWESSRLAGRVMTMRTAPADGQTSHRHLGTAAIERAGRGEIIVIQQAIGWPPASGTWGGLPVQAATIKGLGGVVIDGICVRQDVGTSTLPPIAREKSAEVAERAEQREAKEADTRKRIAAGESTLTSYGF